MSLEKKKPVKRYRLMIHALFYLSLIGILVPAAVKAQDKGTDISQVTELENIPSARDRDKSLAVDQNSVPPTPLNKSREAGSAEKQIVNSLTLHRCIQIALTNNPDIAIKSWGVEAARAERDLASGQFWPTLNATAGYTHYLNNQKLVPARYPGDFVLYTDEIFSSDLVLAMPLYTGGRILNKLKATEMFALSAEHRLSRTREELIFNVSSVYFSILGQKKLIESLKFSQKTLKEHQRRVEELIDVKKAAKVDLLRTEVRLADIEQKLLSDENVLGIQHDLLANVLGIEKSGSEINISDPLRFKKLYFDSNQSLSNAYSNRPDLKAAESDVQAQERLVDASRAEHWPIISLAGSYGGRWSMGSSISPGNASDAEDVGNIGVVAVFPLFEGGRIEAGVRREHSKLFASKESLRKLKLRVKLEVQTAVSNIDSAKARVISTKKAIEQAGESLRIEREKYNLGKGAIVDVLDAQTALLGVQTSYYRALADYNIAIVQWRLAVGEAI